MDALESVKAQVELERFQILMRKRGIGATIALSLFITVAFVLEWMWGGAEFVPTLYKMGANSKRAVGEGAYWRLVTSVFLHGGFLHYFFNVYVLFILGSFFNRLLGGAQFIVLFLASGIAGSLASVFLSKADVSLGASGALWGIFGASAAFTTWPSAFFPHELRLRIRRITFTNIAINLFISLLPMIDIWAHIGGGVGGFLIGSWLMNYHTKRFQDEASQPNSSKFFTGLAIACVSLIGLCFGIALGQQKPWEMTSKVTLVEKSLGKTGLAMGFPDFLPAPQIVRKKEGFLVKTGQFPRDPMMIGLLIVELEAPLSKEERYEQFQNLKQVLPNYEAEGFKLEQGPKQGEIEGFYTGEELYRDEKGVGLFVGYQVREQQIIRLEITLMPGISQTLVESLWGIMKTVSQEEVAI